MTLKQALSSLAGVEKRIERDRAELVQLLEKSVKIADALNRRVEYRDKLQRHVRACRTNRSTSLVQIVDVK